MDETSVLGYRDFFIIPHELRWLKNSLNDFISQWNQGFSFIEDSDLLNNIHIHAISNYKINYEEKPLDQLNWIVGTLEEYKLSLLRWFNSEKLKNNIDITKKLES